MLIQEKANNEAFLYHLPKNTFAGEYKNNAIFQNRDKALTKAYIDPNYDGYRYIIIDIDYDCRNCSLQVDIATGSPPPNFAVINQSNGHAHLFYRLKHSINPANRKSVNYFKNISYALTEHWFGDQGFIGKFSKNPLNNKWKTIHFKDESWSLDELLPYSKGLMHKAQYNEPNLHASRNCSIFDTVRFLAYANAHKISKLSKNKAELYLLVFCEEENAKYSGHGLKSSELRSIARSIAKFVQAGGRGKAYKINIKPNMSANERRQAGGRYSASLRKERSNTALTNSYNHLLGLGHHISIRTLASHAGISTPTVQRWKRENQVSWLDKHTVVRPRGVCKDGMQSGIYSNKGRQDNIKIAHKVKKWVVPTIRVKKGKEAPCIFGVPQIRDIPKQKHEEFLNIDIDNPYRLSEQNGRIKCSMEINRSIRFKVNGSSYSLDKINISAIGVSALYMKRVIDSLPLADCKKLGKLSLLGVFKVYDKPIRATFHVNECLTRENSWGYQARRTLKTIKAINFH